jgi:hypothetical protein
MSASTQSSLSCLPEVFGLALLCACCGCWERIEYKGPDPATAQQAESPPPATVVTSDPPMALGGNGDGAEIPTKTPVSEATTPNDVPTQVPPTADAAPAAEPPEAVGTRYAGSESADAPSAESVAASNAATPPDSSPEASTDPPAATDVQQPPNTRRAAWELGSKLSIVALATDRGITENVPAWAKQATAAAKVLGVQLARLPDRPAASDADDLASKQVLNYLFVQGQAIGATLAKNHGPDHAALLEVAVKSNLLILLYQPGSSTTETISTAIAQAAPRAKLPSELWQPLVDSLKKGAPLADVRAAVRQFHADVDQFLAKSVEQ